MGTLAAASAGALTGPGAASSGSLDESGSGSNNHLATYASPTGRINTEGARDAQDDYQNGNITNSEFRDAIRAWNTGRRVVNKTVVDLDSNISQDTTLQKNPNNPGGDAVVYRVTSDIFVSAELTIDPGVVMEFQQGKRMTFGSNATILAQGTAQEPIFISATNATRGWWDGFYFNSADLNNTMEYVTMEFGGRDLNGNIDMASGFGDSSSLQMSNCTLRYSGQYGLYLDNGAELLSGSGDNTYTESREGAAYARTSNMDQLSSSSTYTGNDHDYVFVNSNTASGSGADSETRTWDAIDVPWRMDGGHTVNEMELNVAPGATFEFTQQSRLTFQNNARMTIEGTSSDPITFTGSQKTRGWWDGIYMETTDTENTMHYTVAEYGANGLSGNLEIATAFGESGSLELQNSTFRHAAGYGMYCGSNTTLERTESNTYAGNLDGAVRVQAPTMHMLSDTSDFRENDNDYVFVSTNNISGSGPGSETITWDNINVPWRIDGRLKVNEIELVVAPGGTYEFTESSQLFFENNAKMTISGIDNSLPEEQQIQTITFTGTDKQRGWWDGIYTESTLTDNIMEYVTVEYGGNDLSGNLETATNFGESAELKLKQCTFRHSDGHGIYCGGGTTLKETLLNTYTGNAAGPARIQAPTMHMLSDTSDFTGNDNDHVLVSTNNVNGSSDIITWDNINVPWRIDGRLKVNDYELEIDPGTTLEFTESSQLYFENNAVMTIEGTESEVITFTGTDKQRGWWDGIYMETESVLNTMKYTVVEYGADDLSANLEIGTEFGESGQISINNCTFREADGHGLYAGSNVDLPNSDNNTYTANASGAASLQMDSIHHLSADSDFTGNDNDVVAVRNANLSESDLPSGQSVATWDAINVPYRFKGNDTTHSVVNVELVIDPGAELRFEERAQLWFQEDSVINVQGTSSDPITFTGTQRAIDRSIAGWWDGIYISSTSVLNIMEHVVVELGGRDLAGNIEIGTGFGDGGSLSLNNSTIRNSGGSGVFYDPSDLDPSSWSGNTYSNNAGGDVIAQN